MQTVRPQSTISSLNYSCQVFYQRKKNVSHIKNKCSIYLNFSLSSSIDGKGTGGRAFISTHTLCVCYSGVTLLCLLLMFIIGRNDVQRAITEESLLLAISYTGLILKLKGILFFLSSQSFSTGLFKLLSPVAFATAYLMPSSRSMGPND